MWTDLPTAEKYIQNFLPTDCDGSITQNTFTHTNTSVSSLIFFYYLATDARFSREQDRVNVTHEPLSTIPSDCYHSTGEEKTIHSLQASPPARHTHPKRRPTYEGLTDSHTNRQFYQHLQVYTNSSHTILTNESSKSNSSLIFHKKI